MHWFSLIIAGYGVWIDTPQEYVVRFNVQWWNPKTLLANVRSKSIDACMVCLGEKLRFASQAETALVTYGKPSLYIMQSDFRPSPCIVLS